jgi:hypothetical protein
MAEEAVRTQSATEAKHEGRGKREPAPEIDAGARLSVLERKIGADCAQEKEAG